MRVCEISAFIAAPYAGLSLAQMGADVIRIDPIGGGLDYHRWPLTRDGKSLYWAGLNKGKRSVTIDVRQDEGRELAQSLMTLEGEDGGFVLTNLPARGWLDFEGLRVLREDLIMVNILGSRDGSVAIDYTVNARAGFPLVTGPVDGERPVNHVLPAWDVITAMSAVSGLLAADRHRRATGEGQYVKLALADVAFATLSHLGFVAEAQITGDARPATGNHVYGTYGHDFATKDERRVMITAFTPRHWSAVVEATGIADKVTALAETHDLDLDREEARYQLRDEITDLLAPWFAAHSLDEIATALDAVGACWGPYRSFAQAVDEDPDISTDNPMFREIDQPGIGKFLAAGPALDFAAAPRDEVRAAPLLGQHTDEVLAELLGLGDRKIGELHDTGIVAGPAG
jgi:2-methylfumaryl-CoA isomerase